MMADSQAIAAGIGAMMSSAALLPWIFKGKLRHEREIIDLERSHGKEIALHDRMIAERDETIDRLEESLAKSETEVRKLYQTNAEQNKEVIDTVKFLQSLAGLAQSERRRPEPRS